MALKDYNKAFRYGKKNMRATFLQGGSDFGIFGRSITR